MVLVAVLGFTIAVQIRSHGDDSLDGARTEDLVRILADLDAQRSRLGDEIAELEIARDELASGSLGDQAALNGRRNWPTPSVSLPGPWRRRVAVSN